MANTLIAHPELSNAAVLTTAAAVASSMPLGYLQKPQPTDVCRFTDVKGGTEFTVDLTDAMASTGITQWRLVALTHSNASGFATWRVRAANSSGGLSSPTYDSRVGGIDLSFWLAADLKPWWPRVHTFLLLPTARTETWLRITVNDEDNPDTFLDIGCLIIADPFQPALPRKHGEVPDDVEQERVIQAEGGPEYARESGSQTIFNFTLQAVGPDAQEEAYFGIRRIKRLRGTSKPVLVIDDPDDTTFPMEGIVYGRLVNLRQITHPQFEQYEVEMTVKEMR